ncbi:MAG: hypothetical protein SFW67_28470 [Myxococcaceae bacterium]|nr:hypothetical protein [Myxococcaceae bacterium]
MNGIAGRYEVHGCRCYGDECGGIEQVPDADAEFWTVYKRDADGSLCALEDFATRQGAETFRDQLAYVDSLEDNDDRAGGDL